MKLVDTPDLGSGAARRGGSSPSIRTIQLMSPLNMKCGTAHQTPMSDYIKAPLIGAPFLALAIESLSIKQQ